MIKTVFAPVVGLFQFVMSLVNAARYAASALENLCQAADKSAADYNNRKPAYVNNQETKSLSKQEELDLAVKTINQDQTVS